MRHKWQSPYFFVGGLPNFQINLKDRNNGPFNRPREQPQMTDTLHLPVIPSAAPPIKIMCLTLELIVADNLQTAKDRK